MIYTGIDLNVSPYFEHYGIKGMRWGHRKQRSLSGNFHRVLAANNRLNARVYRKLGNNTFASMNEAAAKQQIKKAETADARKMASKSGTARHQKIKKAVAVGAGIVGAAAVTYGAYKLSKYASTPQGKASIKGGLDFIKNKTVRGAQRARLAGQGINRTVSNMPGARAAAKAYAAASLVSDVNSAQQFARHVHKNGKITGKDLKNFAIDIAMPIPDNIPGISRNKYDRNKRW